MTNTEKTIICTVITCMLIIFLTIGTCISMQWYTSTHHDFQMETVKTGDVPQVPKAEIAALIRQHDKETRL
jgi:hypothetical protein